jgi:hypothetical protein
LASKFLINGTNDRGVEKPSQKLALNERRAPT